MYLRSHEVLPYGGVRSNVFPTKSAMCRHGNVGTCGMAMSETTTDYPTQLDFFYLTLQLETKCLVMHFFLDDRRKLSGYKLGNID